MSRPSRRAALCRQLPARAARQGPSLAPRASPTADTGTGFAHASDMELSYRNQLKGRVVEIIRGEVVSEVDIETPAGRISAVITTRSIERMGLKVGNDVLAVIKATEVGIERP